MNPAPEAEADPSPDEPGAPPAPIPWPPGAQDSVIAALAETWWRAVWRPRSFFAGLPGSLAFGAALLYYLVVGILGAGVRLFWTMLLPRPESTLVNELLGSAVQASPLVDFLTAPLYLLLSLFLAAGITHLLVLALIPQHRPIGATLRVYCFAYSPVLFVVVPYVGAVVAVVWMTVLSIIGVRAAHATSTGRAAAAVLLPLGLALAVIAVAYVLLAHTARLFGT